MVERAVASSANGIEGLELPTHLVPMTDGQLDLGFLATPVKQQVAEMGLQAQVGAIAKGLALPWPSETPLQLISVPVTTSHCSTAGISLLSKPQALSRLFPRFVCSSKRGTTKDTAWHNSHVAYS